MRDFVGFGDRLWFMRKTPIADGSAIGVFVVFALLNCEQPDNHAVLSAWR